MTVMQHLE